MAKSQKTQNKTEQKKHNKQTIQKALGVFLMLLGAYLIASLTSYLFTWKLDQSYILTKESAWEILFVKDYIVANWAGRLGALSSHFLFYNGIGIASFVFAASLIVLGLKILNPSTYLALKKWRKWIFFSVLFISPVLSLFFPDLEIHLGGTYGNNLTQWIGGFAGPIGNILLFSTIGFVFLRFVFTSPSLLFKNSKKIINTDDSKSEEKKFKGYKNPEEAQQEKGKKELKIEETQEKSHDIASNSINKEAITVNDVYKNKEEEEKAAKNIVLELPKEEKENKIAEGEKELTNRLKEEKEEDTDFEITTAKTEEKAQINHGAHISIESGEPYDPSLELSNYKFPTLDLLIDYEEGQEVYFNKEELENNKDQIIRTLKSFSIEINKIKATVGPTVTLYEIVPKEGVRISKIKNLEDDIALSLAALGIRIIAPIPGRGTIGIEVPNSKKQLVGMRSILASEKFINNKMTLPIALGKKIDNENFIVDLATMPHLLMAGATGQGKSVGINAILVSLLYKKHPSQLKFVMVDPKKVELSIYRLIEKHYLAKLPDEEEPIITDVTKVVSTLNALGVEMDNRYELLKEARARNIKEYNEKFIKRQLNPLDGHKYLPYIVLVIDEFADLIMVAGKEIEMPIARLAQLARAVGIHLIIATQRPSVNVITGIIKANFPARIAFKVSAKVDSRTILDAGGAEQLIGKGDMLYTHGNEPIRLQCAFVDTPEVERVVEFIGEQQGYPTAFELPEPDQQEEGERSTVDLSKRDPLFEQCARLVVETESGSTSMLQRHNNIGYNRAGRIMDQLEAAGIVGPQVGSKPREVYVFSLDELQQIFSKLP
ncbi:MAG TPA: DNA translocase FtsK [Chitinophagaceae bacterium]|nr:DNA translocase FtsK [Chitinophagaceae bacterium]